MGPGKTCQRHNASRNAKLGQSGIELLFLVGIMSTILLIIVLVSYQAQLDISALSADLEAKRVCHELAFRISAVDAAGNGTSTSLGIPELIFGKNYTVFVSGPGRSISILHEGGLVGCPMSTSSIANGTGMGASDRFEIHSGEGKYLINSGQGVVIG